MNRQFEKEYTQSNDRIHPRQELLQELEAKWAAEQARQAEQKVRAFPTWARFVAAAAGILLCIGVGMGSVMLYTRNRGLGKATAVAEASVETEGAADLAAESPEEETILYEAEAAPAATEFPAMMLAAPAEEAPQGTHFALDEAEVENAVRLDTLREDAGVQAAGTAAPTQLPAAAEGTAAGEAAETAAYPRGKVIRRDDLYAVFLPTLEQVHIVEYADRKISNLFSLTLREKGTQVENVFWIDGELLALRTRNGETELLRGDGAAALRRERLEIAEASAGHDPERDAAGGLGDERSALYPFPLRRRRGGALALGERGAAGLRSGAAGSGATRRHLRPGHRL